MSGAGWDRAQSCTADTRKATRQRCCGYSLLGIVPCWRLLAGRVCSATCSAWPYFDDGFKVSPRRGKAGQRQLMESAEGGAGRTF